MYNCYFSELLVLVLLLASGVRIFLLKNPRIDCFAAFSPLALIFSVITLLCFGASFLRFSIFILSFLSFLTNFRSVLRLRSKLIVDHYGNAFLISTIIELVLTFLTLAFLFVHRPAKLVPKEFSAQKTQFLLSGNTLGETRIKEEFFKGQKTTGTLFIYKPDTNDEIAAKVYSENPVLIFAGNFSAPVQNYEPYFLLLAKKGFTVAAADFYTRDTAFFKENAHGFFQRHADSKFFRYFFSKILRFSDEKRFSEIQKKDKEISPLKYNTLTKLALGILGAEKKIFYLTDGIGFEAISSVIEENSPNATGFYSLNRIDEYKTSGFGFIEQTDPIFASKFGLKRDKSLFIPRYAANKTIENIVK